MKRGERIYYIIIGMAIMAAAAVLVFKFVLSRKSPEPFAIKNFDKITVTAITGDEVKLSELMVKDEPSYCLIFELKDCPSCIYRGLEDLKRLRDGGKSSIGLVIHDYIEDVEGWASSNEFSPLYMLKRTSFYDYFHSPITPVMVKLENDRVVSYRYIVP